MNRNRRIYVYAPILTIFLIMLAIACSKNLLDKKPLNGISDDALWSDQNLVLTFINQRYDQIGHGWPESWMSSVCDETYLTWALLSKP